MQGFLHKLADKAEEQAKKHGLMYKEELKHGNNPIPGQSGAQASAVTPGTTAGGAGSATAAYGAQPAAGAITPPATDPTATTTTGGVGGGKLAGVASNLQQSPTVTGLSHQLKLLQNRYMPGQTVHVKALQTGISAEKTIALDHDTLSRDLLTLNKETDTWVKDLPVIPVSAGSTETSSIYASPALPTLLNLTSQLSSLHKVLSTKLLDARVPLKTLRDLETNIEGRETRVKQLEVQQAKKASEEAKVEVEKLRAEIKELEMGLGVAREEAVRVGEEKTWEAYGEFAKNLLYLSHAATILTPLLPNTSHNAPVATKGLTQGEQRDSVRAVEESLRKSLGGLEGGWGVSVADKVFAPGPGGRASPIPIGHKRSESFLRKGSPIPAYVQDSSAPLHADTIVTYPSTLNQMPAPIPISPQNPRGSFSGGGTPGSPHKHRSSFDHPITPMSLPTHQNSESAIAEDDLPASAATGPGLVEVPSHPTIAETGIPIASPGGPGPATGQLTRTEGAPPPGSQSQIPSAPSTAATGTTGQLPLPPTPAHEAAILPPPTHPAVASALDQKLTSAPLTSEPAPVSAPVSGEKSGWEQAQAQLAARGIHPEAESSSAAAGTLPNPHPLPPVPTSKADEAAGDALPTYKE